MVTSTRCPVFCGKVCFFFCQKKHLPNSHHAWERNWITSAVLARILYVLHLMLCRFGISYILRYGVSDFVTSYGILARNFILNTPYWVLTPTLYLLHLKQWWFGFCHEIVVYTNHLRCRQSGINFKRRFPCRSGARLFLL